MRRAQQATPSPSRVVLCTQSALLATGTVNEIAESTGFYGNAFWVSTSMCAFSWLINLMYVFLLRHVGEADTTEKIRKRLRQKNLFKPSVLMRFPLSFWIIIFLSLVFGASWGPFTHITTYGPNESDGVTTLRRVAHSPRSHLRAYHARVQRPHHGSLL